MYHTDVFSLSGFRSVFIATRRRSSQATGPLVVVNDDIQRRNTSNLVIYMSNSQTLIIIPKKQEKYNVSLYNLYLENKILAPAISSFITTIIGFYIGYVARKKKLPNERISTLKEINLILDEIEDGSHLQLVVKKQMRSAILEEISGLKDEKLALLFTRIESATSLSNRQRHALRKFIKNLDLEYNKDKSTKEFDFYKIKADKQAMIKKSFLLFSLSYILGGLFALFIEGIAIYATVLNDGAVAWFMTLVILAAIIIMSYNIHKLPNPSDYYALKNAFDEAIYSHPFNEKKIEAINKGFKSKKHKVNG